MAPTLNIFGFVSRFLYSGVWQVCSVSHKAVTDVNTAWLFCISLSKLAKQYNQNQLTRTVVVREVLNTIVIKYWTVDRFVHWLINICRRRLEGDDTRCGAFAFFLRPHPGAFRHLMCPHPGEFAHLKKNAKAQGLAWGWGGMGTAGIDWCITLRVMWRFSPRPNVETLIERLRNKLMPRRHTDTIVKWFFFAF